MEARVIRNLLGQVDQLKATGSAGSTTTLARREFGKTGWMASEISFGSWAIGGAWGSSRMNDAEAEQALHTFLDSGGNLIDTANVYGDDCGTEGFGRAERIIRAVLDDRKSKGLTKEKIYVITKAGRALVTAGKDQPPHGPTHYTYDALAASVNGSLERLGVQTLDLVQVSETPPSHIHACLNHICLLLRPATKLHCPPISVLQDGAVFDHLRQLKAEGKILHYGVSVETVEEAMISIAQPDCASIQIIFNCFRLKPADEFFLRAKEANVAVIVRVPLASGLLSGKMSIQSITELDDDDHRKFNRLGQCFDKGETFSGLGGVMEEAAFPAVDRLKKLLQSQPELAQMTLAQFSLRWILMYDSVSIIIPGCRNPSQVKSNVGASAAFFPPLSAAVMAEVQAVYDGMIREHVHSQW